MTDFAVPATGKVVLFANTEWYLYNFRRSLALELQAQGYELLLISPPGPYGQKLRELGLRWEPVPMDRRSLNPLSELVLLWYLVRLLRREKPALVHGFTIKCAVYGSLAARLARVPARINAVAGMGYVFTSNDAKARLLRPMVRALMHAALDGRNARLILQNPDDVALFERAGFVDRAHIRLIPGSGVDCSRFVARAPDDGASPLRVLLATRLLWDKGVEEFVAAARQLRGEGRAIRFLLAGDPDPGNPAAVPEANVRAWQAEGVVEWLGHVDDMPALLASVDVVVLPSYREGLPKTLIEAAACALPLVTTDVPGCREVVDDGVNGLLVPPRDVDALAQAIARLHDDPALAVRLGAAARAKALSRFDESIVIADTVGVYRELLEAPLPSTPLSNPPPGVLAPLGRLLLALSMAILLIAVLLPSDALSWLRSDYRAFGQLMNSIEGLMPRVDLTHVLLFGSIGLLSSSLWPRLPWSRIALLLLGLAVGTELVQFLVPGREPRISDAGFDLLGGGLGMIAAMLLQRQWGRAVREVPVDGPLSDG